MLFAEGLAEQMPPPGLMSDTDRGQRLVTSFPGRVAYPRCVEGSPSPTALQRLPREKRDCMRPKKTILCVDDNEQVLSVRTFLLETRGYRVIAARTAQEAIETLDGLLPGTIDLLLCDLLMPGMDGNELVRRAKGMHPGLPAMIVSGTVNSFDRAGYADVFLPKGACSPAEMIERIRVLVARKRGPKKQGTLGAVSGMRVAVAG